MTDLASNTTWVNTLELWRSRMVKQFQEEGRGPDWVSPDGKLMRRVKGQLYSPHYPGRGEEPPRTDQPITLF